MALVGQTWILPFIPYLAKLPFGQNWKTIWSLASLQIPPLPSVEDFAPSTECLKGKSIIVTGANVGLGQSASLHFARLRPKTLILACRSVSKGRLAQQEIIDTLKKEGIRAFDGSDPDSSTKIPSSNHSDHNGETEGSAVDIRVWELNLSDFSSLKKFSDRWKEEMNGGKIDILAENAGVFNRAFETTGDGHENMLQVNVLSAFLLPLLLLPYLQPPTSSPSSSSTRLIIVSSSVHNIFQRPLPPKSPSIYQNIDSLNGWIHPGHRYGMTKYLEIVFSRRLYSLLNPNLTNVKNQNQNKTPITIAVVDPGLCHSALARDVDNWGLWLRKVFIARSTEMGSRTLVHGAIAREVEEVGRGDRGGATYWSSLKLGRLSPLITSQDPTIKEWNEQIWEETVDLLIGVEPSLKDILRP